MANENNFGTEIMSIGSLSPFDQQISSVAPTEISKSGIIKEESQVIESDNKVEKGIELLEKIESKTPEKKEEKSHIDSKKSSNAAYLLAESFKKDGVLPNDIKIEEGISAKDLKNLIIENSKQDALESVRSEFEEKFNPDIMKTAELINKGVNPEDLQEVNYYKRIAAIKLGDDDDKNLNAKEFAIKAMYEDKGFSEKKIEKLVSDSMEDDEGDSDFEDAKKHFANKAITIEKEIQAKIENEEKENQRLQDLTNKEIKSLIKSGEVYNTEDDKAKKELETFLFEQTETIKENNKTYRITGFQKKMQEYNKDIKQQLTFAKLLMSGFDLASVENKGKLSKAEELDALLEGSIQAQSKNTKEDRVGIDFSKMQEVIG